MRQSKSSCPIPFWNLSTSRSNDVVFAGTQTTIWISQKNYFLFYLSMDWTRCCEILNTIQAAGLLVRKDDEIRLTHPINTDGVSACGCTESAYADQSLVSPIPPAPVTTVRISAESPHRASRGLQSDSANLPESVRFHAASRIRMILSHERPISSSWVTRTTVYPCLAYSPQLCDDNLGVF